LIEAHLLEEGEEDEVASEERIKEVCTDVEKDLSWSIDELGKDIKDATPDKKKAIKESIANLKKRVAELKELIAGKIVEAAATAAAVKRMMAESVVALKDRLVNTAGDAKVAVQERIAKLNNQIVTIASVAKAKMVRAATIAVETVMAVKDALLDRVEELNAALKKAADDSKEAIKAQLARTQTQLGNLADAAQDKATQAFTVAVAVKDMMADKIADLHQRISKESAEAKVKLQHRIDDMNKRIDAMKISAYNTAVEVGATLNAVKELVSESIVALTEQMAEKAGAAKDAIGKRLAMFKNRLGQVGAAMREKISEAAVFAKDTFVAVKDMISENLNDMRLALAEAADEKKAQIQEGIDALQGHMAKLSAAAGDKAAQAYAGAAAVTAMLGENLVLLGSQARDATGAAKEAIEKRMHELGVQLVEMRAAAYAKVVDVGAFLMASKELVSEKIIELHEKISQSAEDAAVAIKARVLKLQERSIHFGKAAMATLRHVVVEVAATVMAVTELLIEGIVELKDRIANSAAVQSMKHQYEIRMEDMKKRLAVMKESAGNKLAEATATAAAFKEMLGNKIADMGESMKDASVATKKRLQEGMVKLQSTLKAIGSYTMDRILETPAMAVAVKDAVAEQIYSLGQKMAAASAEAKAAIKATIDKLQVKLVDMGGAVVDFAKKAVRMTVDAVIAVKDMAVEKIGELKNAIATASRRPKSNSRHGWPG